MISRGGEEVALESAVRAGTSIIGGRGLRVPPPCLEEEDRKVEPIDRRLYQELLFTGRQWMRRRGRGRGACIIESKFRSPPLYFHGGGEG